MPLTDSNERYVNFYTDFAFKKLFGTEMNKDYDYRESQKDFWDLFSVTETAEKKGEERGIAIGEEKGRKERDIELIQRLSSKGKSPKEIAELLDVDIEEVQKYIADR